MRDDLHRGAPVPPRWATTIQATARDADWRDEAPRAIARAIARDANEEIGNDLVRWMHGRSSQVSMFDVVADAERAVGRSLSTMETNALRALSRIAGGSDSVERAITIALGQHVDAINRKLQAHVVAKDRACAPEFSQRYSQAMDRGLIQQAARQRAACANVPVRQPPAPRVSADFVLVGAP